MSTRMRNLLLQQLDLAWHLASYHMQGMTNEEALWRPAACGLHVWPVKSDELQPGQLLTPQAEGSQPPGIVWRADFPEHERYDLGPASIAWISWHMIYWWSQVWELSRRPGAPAVPQTILWPGTIEAASAEISRLYQSWRDLVQSSTEADLLSSERSRWPIVDVPWAEIVTWVNIELTKNASEWGMIRFLYAVREQRT